MLHHVMKKIDKLVGFDKASAHCDIPCKIYDPSTAQIAALSLIRMVDLLLELETQAPHSLSQLSTIARLTTEKEQQGIKVKEEIRIIWSDYIKQPQLDAYPVLHTLTHNIMLKASFNKQHIDRAAAIELLKLVNEFAEIFWQSKNVATYTATCPYLPSESVVYPDLKG